MLKPMNSSRPRIPALCIGIFWSCDLCGTKCAVWGDFALDRRGWVDALPLFWRSSRVLLSGSPYM